MKRFLRNILVTCIAISPIFIYYIIVDPYSVVWKKDATSCPNAAVKAIWLMNTYEDSLHYNSFILGSSRSENYFIDDWTPHLGNHACGFHFWQSGDNIRGSYERLKYLYARFNQIDNILIIMDHQYLSNTELNEGFNLRNPWEFIGIQDIYAFHRDFFSAFIEPKNQIKYWRNNEPILKREFVSEYNEWHRIEADSMINNGHLAEYYEKYIKPLNHETYLFYDRDTIQFISSPIILEEQYAILCQIKELLSRGNTSYRIVISPLFDQKKINPSDISVLNDIFGKEYVFDFSGINEFTQDINNYYEASHYRPCLCKRIVDIIYK